MEPSPAPDAEMRLPGLIDSNPRETLEAIENLLATPGLDPHYRVNLLTLAGHVAAVLDHRARATRHLRSALAGAKRLGDRKAEGRAHERLAHLAAREGALAHHRRDNAAAQAEFQTVLDIDDARPEAAADSDMARLRRREARIGAIGHLGDIEREAGTHAGAAEWRSRGVATARQSQNGADEVAMLLAKADAAPAAAPRLRAPVLASLGARQSEEGQPELARESMTAGIAPSNQIGDLGQAIGARRTLADFEGECGNWAAAIDL
ncbi:MAG: hypothetical protein LBT54_04185, partial [Bifidobacteriaceae bacterium]|nr:hypothetical protein [Bifidobacteriaceae bacterium]